MQANFTLMTMKIFQMPNFKIYSFGKKKFSNGVLN